MDHLTREVMIRLCLAVVCLYIREAGKSLCYLGKMSDSKGMEVIGTLIKLLCIVFGGIFLLNAFAIALS
jgi:hypothetical protein